MEDDVATPRADGGATPSRWPWLVPAMFLAASGGGIALLAAAGDSPGDIATSSDWLLGPAAFAVVGAVVLSRGHRVMGWLFCAVALIAGLATVGDDLATYQYLTVGGVSGFGLAGAWLNSWYWFPFMSLFVIWIPLLYPDGRFASRRWRRFAAVPAVAVAGLAFLMMFGKDLQLHAFSGVSIPNPVGFLGRDIDDQAVSSPLYLALIASVVGAVASLGVRFRRSHGVEREQVKWFLYVAAGAPVFLILASPHTGPTSDLVRVLSFLGTVVFLGVFVGLPIAMGIAILKHGLYDIDRIVSRTLSYAIVTAVLLGTYAAVVLTASAAVGSEGAPEWAVAAATLAAAALFRPVRGRVQAFVDRRFNRTRFNAVRAAEAFGQELRHDIDLQDVTVRLAGVVDGTLQPTHLSIWLPDRGAGTV